MPVPFEAVTNERQMETKRASHRRNGANAQQHQEKERKTKEEVGKTANHFTAFIKLSLDFTAKGYQRRRRWDLTAAVPRKHAEVLKQVLSFYAKRKTTVCSLSPQTLHPWSNMVATSSRKAWLTMTIYPFVSRSYWAKLAQTCLSVVIPWSRENKNMNIKWCRAE